MENKYIKPIPKQAARIFMQYWGQQFFYKPSYRKDLKIAGVMVNILTSEHEVIDQDGGAYLLRQCYLPLKPLGRISAEDAIALGQLFGLRHAKIHIRGEKSTSITDDSYILYVVHTGALEMHKRNEFISESLLKGYDFLRSRGYALPWGQYSVEQLVEAGIYKITG